MEPSRWSRVVTIAAVVSYSHMYELALRHGEPQWRAALFPLSVDGMIVGTSMTLLSDARHGRRGGLLPWALLILGSVASLAANVAVADPTMWSRIIHAWPSFALIGAYELLMREFRNTAKSVRTAYASIPQDGTCVTGECAVVPEEDEAAGLRIVSPPASGEPAAPLPPFQVRAWEWAEKYKETTGRLPTGKEITDHFGRKERWGRLVKERGLQQRRSMVAGGDWA